MLGPASEERDQEECGHNEQHSLESKHGPALSGVVDHGAEKCDDRGDQRREVGHGSRVQVIAQGVDGDVCEGQCKDYEVPEISCGGNLHSIPHPHPCPQVDIEERVHHGENELDGNRAEKWHPLVWALVRGKAKKPYEVNNGTDEEDNGSCQVGFRCGHFFFSLEKKVAFLF